MKLKLPKLTPKKISTAVKDPRTYFKIFNQLFPLGSGGLRTGYKEPKHDFLDDISVPYDYTGPSLDLGGGPQEATAPRSGLKFGIIPKEDTRWKGAGLGQWAPTDKHKDDEPRKPILIPWSLPGETDDVQDIPDDEPSLPTEDQPQPTGDVPEDDDDDDEPFKPWEFPRNPECSDSPTIQRLLGIPPCTKGVGSISFQTKKLRKNGPKSKAYRKSRNGNFPF